MSMSYVPPYFVVQELVPPEIFKKYGDQSIRYIDPRLSDTLSFVRGLILQPMTVNNWHTGGDRLWSGLRVPGSPYYSMGSAHSYGQAFDAVGNWDADDVRQKIIDNQHLLPHHIRLEIGISWLHVDVMNVSQTWVQTFKP